MKKLSKQSEQDLISILDHISDPEVRRTQERQLRRQFAQRDEEAAASARVFQEAREWAVLHAHPDPVEHALLKVETAKKLRMLERRTRAALGASLRAAAKDADRLADRYERASRTANPGQRRKLQQDRKYVAILGDAEREGRFGSVEAEIEKNLRGYKPECWEKATLPLKVLALCLETKRIGGRTINLRISDEMGHKALASERGPVSFVQNQVREMLKRTFADDAPDFWFVMERDTKERFHLHGAYVAPAHIDHALIDDALRRASRWGDPSTRGKAQVSDDLGDAYGWAAYLLKRMNLTRMVTERKLLACTAPLRSSAMGRWASLRENLPRCASLRRKTKS
jgi:hypothetical protein